MIIPIPPKVLHPNARTRNFRYRAAMAKKARGDAMAVALAAGLRIAGPVVMHATWYHRQRCFRRHDDDNLTAWLKASRDGIAEACGIDDQLISMGSHTQDKDTRNPRVEIRFTPGIDNQNG